MKRRLLVAALSLCTLSAWAANPVLTGQNPLTTSGPLSPLGAPDVVSGEGTGSAITGSKDHAAITALSPEALKNAKVAVVTIELYKTGHGRKQLAQSFSLTASTWEPVHSFSGTSVSYRAEASGEKGPDGKPVPPVVKNLDVGTTLALAPIVVVGDKALLSLDIAQRQLLSMQTFSADGVTIDLPSTKETAVSQHIGLRVGQSVTMSSSDDGDIVVRLDHLDGVSGNPTSLSAR